MASARDRETILIDLALSVGAGLGRRGTHLTIEAVREWRDHFSWTIGRRLRKGGTWKEDANRQGAKIVAEKMGRKAARLIEDARKKRLPIGSRLALAARADVGPDDSCAGAGMGKWCDPT